MVGCKFSARQQLPIRSKCSGSCLKTCFSLCSLPVLFSQLLESFLSIWTIWESCLPKTISFSQKDSASSDPWEYNTGYSHLHHASLNTDASRSQDYLPTLSLRTDGWKPMSIVLNPQSFLLLLSSWSKERTKALESSIQVSILALSLISTLPSNRYYIWF